MPNKGTLCIIKDMVTKELMDYIKSSLTAGKTTEEIKNTLRQQGGWTENDLEEAFSSNQNTPSLFNNKGGVNTSLSKIEIIISSIIITIEICSAVFFVWFIIYRASGWNGILLVYFFFPLLDIFSIWGIFKGITLLKEKGVHFISVLLLVLSLCSFAPPYSIGYILKPVTTLIEKRQYKNNLLLEEKANKQLQDLKNETHERYEILRKEFEIPQKISAVDTKYTVLILENGYIIRPINPFYSTKELANFIDWAKENLVSKEIEIKFPSEDFNILYCTDPDALKKEDWTFKTVEQNNNISNKNNICSILLAEIFYNGKSVEKIILDK